MSFKNCILFGLSNSKEIAERISKITKINLGHSQNISFADGEFLFKTDDVVRGKHVFLIQSTSKPVNDNIMELLIAIDGIRRASAKSISIVIPYYGYSRQDRKSKGREPITSRLVADMLQIAGADRVLTIDIHSPQQQGFFSIPFDSLTATWLLLDRFIRDNPKKDIKQYVIVSPDYGSVKRARSIAERVGAGFAIVDKRRPRANIVEVSSILGEVKNKDCLIIDDMIDTGNTILASCKLLKQHNAKSISIIATHGLFNNNALVGFNEAYKEKLINNLYISNTITNTSLPKFIKVIDVSEMLASAVDVMANEIGSLSKIYQKYKYFESF